MSYARPVAPCLALLIASAVAAHGDLITDWNAVAFDIMRAGNVDGAPAARTLAILHVSMADAVNTTQNHYTRYAYRGKLQPEVSPDRSSERCACCSRDALSSSASQD